MKTTDAWRHYLSELVNTRSAPVVDAFKWTRAPRAVQHGVGYPRVGESALKGLVCRLWEYDATRSRK